MALGLYLTSRCNLNCKFCFNWEIDNFQSKKELLYEDVCQILDAGREKGQSYLTLTGGEPFLYKDIFKVIDYAYDRGYFITILSNGLLIDKNVTDKLKGKSRLRIRISFEGATPEVHEYFRGKNTFFQALQAVQILVKSNLNVGIGFTVYKENLNDVEAIVKLGIEQQCNFIRFSPVVRLLKGKQAIKIIDLHENTLIRIITCQIKYKNYVELPGAEAGFSLPLESIYAKRCEAGCNFFAINPEKILLPCPLLRTDPAIFRRPFSGSQDFDEMARRMDLLFAEIGGSLPGRCAACNLKEWCCGGCLAEKLSFDLSLFDEQPICPKRILEKVETKFSAHDLSLLKKSWIFLAKKRQEDGRKFCYRQAPFWTIQLKPCRSESKGNYRQLP